MDIQGKGVLKDPITGRALYDFADGPLVTEDPKLIGIAEAAGFGKDAKKPAEAGAEEKRPPKAVKKQERK